MGFLKDMFKKKEAKPAPIIEDKPKPVAAVKPPQNVPVIFAGTESPRKIRPELKEFITKRIDGLPEKYTPTQLVCAVAKALDGITEKGGSNKGKEVEWLQDTIGDVGREAWCMSTVQSIIGYCEQVIGRKSELSPGEHCLTVWNETSNMRRIPAPAPGCIIIWRHGTSSAGHTGIVLEVEPSGLTMITLEGNTGPSNTIVEREGDGCYIKRRSTKGSGDMKIVGYIKPF
jgi:hypothetical protein